MGMGDWVSAALRALEAQAPSGDETARLRAAVYRDGQVTAEEVRTLLRLHAEGAGKGAGAAWSDLLIETVVDHYALSRAEPDAARLDLASSWGRVRAMVADTLSLGLAPDPVRQRWVDAYPAAVNDAEARVLIDALAADGLALDATETRLLARLFSSAVTYPESLRQFALEALSATVAADGAITDEEAALVRAIVFGPAGEGGLAISRREAETLWRIDHQVRCAAKTDAWERVFAGATAAFLLQGGPSPEALDEAEIGWLLNRLGAEPTRTERAVLAALETTGLRLDPRLAARRAPMAV
jgi:hypothetical protein